MAAGELGPLLVNDVTVVMTTWLPGGQASTARLGAIKTALRSWKQNLWLNARLHLHVADDGSSAEDMAFLESLVGSIWNRGDITWSQQPRHGLGASLNAGLEVAFGRGPAVFHAVDDWQLLAPLDLTPWVKLLLEPDVAMVRFFPHPNTIGRTLPTPYGWVVELSPDQGGYLFGFRPALWHRRLLGERPWFAEGVSALECERVFNDSYLGEAARRGRIVLGLPEVWRPLESVELSAINPQGEVQ